MEPKTKKQRLEPVKTYLGEQESENVTSASQYLSLSEEDKNSTCSDVATVPETNEKENRSTTQGGTKKVPWTAIEDSRLKSVINSHTEGKDADGKTIISLTWGEISELIPHRSAKQCRERWCYNLDPSIKQGPWSLEEDAILLKAHGKYCNQWAQIARFLPGRTENAVKTRFKSMMRAKKREWGKNEDKLIYELVRKYGSKWDVIQKYFPNRTANALKTRFSHLRRGTHKVSMNEIAGTSRQIWLNVGLIQDIDIDLLKKLKANGQSLPPVTPKKVEGSSTTPIVAATPKPTMNKTHIESTFASAGQTPKQNHPQPTQPKLNSFPTAATYPSVLPMNFGLQMNNNNGILQQGGNSILSLNGVAKQANTVSPTNDMSDMKVGLAMKNLTDAICNHIQLTPEQKIMLLDKLNVLNNSFTYYRCS